MSASRIVFICERCLSSDDSPGECCDHPRVRYDAGEPGSALSQPLYDEEGRLRSHAPRWWLERHQGGSESR
jgi:hypothetical protein